MKRLIYSAVFISSALYSSFKSSAGFSSNPFRISSRALEMSRLFRASLAFFTCWFLSGFVGSLSLDMVASSIRQARSSRESFALEFGSLFA